MGKKEVTIDELIDLAIGTPECAVNFLILQKVLKLISRYCCKMDRKFQIDMDNIKGEITTIEKYSRSSFSDSQGSYESNELSGTGEKNYEKVEAIEKYAEVKSENVDEGGSEGDTDNVEKINVKTESQNQDHSTEQKTTESGSEEQKQTESSSRKDADSDDDGKEKREKRNKKESESQKKRNDSKRKSSEKHKKRSSENIRKKDSESNKRRDSDDTKNKLHALEDFTKNSENKTNELENHVKELTDRIESITQTIATHLDEKHLAEINEEIDKLKKNMESTTDECYEVTRSINDQSTQIQDILTAINNIQLRKVENEELIDLLSGKADHSFVNEKVSTIQFEETVQELKGVINESTIQMDSVRLETNASLDEIKQDLLTKLLAEEFDEAKTKIYKELIKLTEQHELILAQQNEHVAAGAKMRNLSCFACNNDVVMLLEQETIPKFRGLKASLQPLEPIVGSKILIDKNAAEWQNHLLKAKDFTKTSKAPRYCTDASFGKETYVKGKNGCMYKGNVGCDCMEAMNAIGRKKQQKCCDMVEANNLKNMSQTNKIRSSSKIIENTVIGDAAKGTAKSDKNNNINSNNNVSQEIATDIKLEVENDVKPKTEITVEAPDEAQPTADPIADSNFTEIKNEIESTIANPIPNVPDDTYNNNDAAPIVPDETTITNNDTANNVPEETNALIDNADVANPIDEQLNNEPQS